MLQVLNSLSKTLGLYRIFRLRQRYLYTRGNRLRLRYVVGSGLILSLTATSFLGSMNASIAFAPASSGAVLAQMRDEAALVKNVAFNTGAGAEINSYAGIAPQALSPQDFADAPTPRADDTIDAGQLAALEPAAAPALPPAPTEEIIQIASGQTVVGALQNAGVSDEDAYNAVKALSAHLDPRSVKAGQSLSLKMEPTAEGLMEFAALNMKIDPIKEVVVSKSGAQDFESSINEKEILVKPNAVKAVIKSSLYGSAARAGIPASIVAELIRIYSYEVDFQRDIREGDKLEVLFETYETEDGDFARYGNVLFANLMVEGRSIPVYRFEPEGGRADYYTAEGLSVRKTLMKTPIDGARISSGFGMRRHPILGYNKMHKGVDFAAAVGTPIFAAGDGTISFAGRKGAYGNYIAIKHNSNLSSAYAHMHKFAKGIRPGQKVEQGQVIGYVGTTGRSTGPHLHFEVLKNGQQINPANLKMEGQRLVGKEMDRFKALTNTMRRQYVNLTEGLKFAKNDFSQ